MMHARFWLLLIHCVNHRLELATKDGFKEDSAFFRSRSNYVRIVPPDSEGTRFQNHKYRVIKALIVNYLPMTLLMENYTCVGSKHGDSSMPGKLKNWLNIFQKFEFLDSLGFY